MTERRRVGIRWPTWQKAPKNKSQQKEKMATPAERAGLITVTSLHNGALRHQRARDLAQAPGPRKKTEPYPLLIRHVIQCELRDNRAKAAIWRSKKTSVPSGMKYFCFQKKLFLVTLPGRRHGVQLGEILDRELKTFLHVGCGPAKKSNTTAGFNTDAWQELRFDIDPHYSPDIVGTVVEMSGVADKSVNAIFSSHNLEHVYPHEVGQVLNEFLRVLSDDGFVVLTCPDLQAVCEFVAADKLLEPIYESPLGPIAPLDVLYGFRPAIAAGKHYMAHKCGFTFSVLTKLFLSSGFKSAYGGRRPHKFDLWIMAFKQTKTETEMALLAREHLPE